MPDKPTKMDRRNTTSFKVDPELWKEVKIEAIRRDMEISDLVEVALKKELGKKVDRTT